MDDPRLDSLQQEYQSLRSADQRKDELVQVGLMSLGLYFLRMMFVVLRTPRAS